MMRPALALCMLAGCLFGEDDDGTWTHLHIDAPVAFDRILVYEHYSGFAGCPLYADAPVTPEMLKTGDRPSQYQLCGMSHGYVPTPYTWPSPRTSASIDLWEISADYRQVLIVGYAGDSLLGGDAATPAYEFRDSAFHGDMKLGPSHPTEIWGAGGDPLCVRVVNGTGSYYSVRGNDIDCDNEIDANDCQPSVYCDPAVATSCCP